MNLNYNFSNVHVIIFITYIGYLYRIYRIILYYITHENLVKKKKNFFHLKFCLLEY